MNSNQTTWQSLIWRLILTVLLLALLSVPGLEIFDTITTAPEAQVLPTATTTTTIMAMVR